MLGSLFPKLNKIIGPRMDVARYLWENDALRTREISYEKHQDAMNFNAKFKDMILENSRNPGSFSEEELREVKEIRNNRRWRISQAYEWNDTYQFREAEKQIARNLRVCTPEQIDFVRATLPQTENFSILARSRDYSIYHRNMQMSLSCVTEAMKENKMGGNFLENYLLHRWIAGSKKIGEGSTFCC